MADRLVLVEREKALLAVATRLATIQSLRREIERYKQKRRSKPINPNHEAGRASFIGPEEMSEVKKHRKQDDEDAVEETGRKKGQKERPATSKVEGKRKRRE